MISLTHLVWCEREEHTPLFYGLAHGIKNLDSGIINLDKISNG